VKFGSAHLKPGRLTPASLDLLFTPMKTAEGKETGYGAGWDIQARKVGHSGSAVGGTAQLVVDRDNGVVAALIADVTLNDRVRKAINAGWTAVKAAFDK
jgi:serine beta-lactamase-like protein LACTB, mitochondrial